MQAVQKHCILLFFFVWPCPNPSFAQTHFGPMLYVMQIFGLVMFVVPITSPKWAQQDRKCVWTAPRCVWAPLKMCITGPKVCLDSTKMCLGTTQNVRNRTQSVFEQHQEVFGHHPKCA
jgi:hypothetical protein